MDEENLHSFSNEMLIADWMMNYFAKRIVQRE
jgi:hypothetical protein